jgi:3',5'-cyclic AMP phosphodiesterase CpdA
LNPSLGYDYFGRSFASDSPKVNESKTVSFSLAHLSDPHLSNVAKRDMFRNFRSKRVIGGVSWFANRRRLHKIDVVNAIRESIIAARCDHVALTGDLVNFAAWNEFPAAAKWLEAFGPPDQLTVVPGNHDAYVNVPWSNGLALFAPWMKPDRQEAMGEVVQFPFLRLRRNIALIGLNSGKPQNWFSAAGKLGLNQRRDLTHLLGQLGHQGFYRVVLIHHPPLPGLCPKRKALQDAGELQAILAAEGCELVLHGHNHQAMLNWIETKSGRAPVIGVPSASSAGDSRHDAAGWIRYDIRRHQGRWTTDMTAHVWDNEKQRVEQKETATLSPP